MGANSTIAWTHHTFNPWWGCTRVSAGCKACYAETFSRRLGRNLWGLKAERRFFDDPHWNEPVKWNHKAERAGERRRVFCASMADVFEDRRDLDASRVRLFDLIEGTPSLDWLLLTKRPENMVGLTPDHWRDRWPTNVWAGTTTENQEAADTRLPLLLDTPAVIRFISVEPLLGPVNLDGALRQIDGNIAPVQLLHWVIVGGESGPGARDCPIDWIRDVVRQCDAAKVQVFVKQLGSRWAHAVPGLRRDSKGSVMSEWPSFLQRQEFPR